MQEVQENGQLQKRPTMAFNSQQIGGDWVKWLAEHCMLLNNNEEMRYDVIILNR